MLREFAAMDLGMEAVLSLDFEEKHDVGIKQEEVRFSYGR